MPALFILQWPRRADKRREDGWGGAPQRMTMTMKTRREEEIKRRVSFLAPSSSVGKNLENGSVGEQSHLFADLLGINSFSLGQTGQRVELKA